MFLIARMKRINPKLIAKRKMRNPRNQKKSRKRKNVNVNQLTSGSLSISRRRRRRRYLRNLPPRVSHPLKKMLA